MYKLVVKRCVPKPKETESAYEELIKALVFSTFVLMINLLLFKSVTLNVMNLLLGLNENSTFTGNSLFMVVGYFALTLIAIVIAGVGFRFFVAPLGRRILNLYRKAMKLPLEVDKGHTAWDIITEVKGFSDQAPVVSIIRGGEVIMSGCLTVWFNSAMTWKDIRLKNVGDVTEKLKSQPDLFEEDCGWYFLNDGTGIMFYKADKYYEYLKS